MRIITKDNSDLSKPPKKPKKPRKYIKRVSIKQSHYERWLETDARPAVITRDGNTCRCCHRSAYDGEKLDLDHVDGKGHSPSLKRDIGNLQLLDRICHRAKTDKRPCNHGIM